MKILEQGVTLSKSNLWHLQENIYKKLGLEAWTKKGVPSYMTSNPYTARQYARLVLAFIRDGLSTNSKHPIDPNEPIYIFDLGAGTGRFAYVFLKQLFSLMKGIHAFEQLTIRYVLTDIVPGNLEFCRTHNYLQPFFQKGILDVAYYHFDKNDPIELQLAGISLSKEKVINPIILIANYYFDTIKQDLFRYKDGVWEEGVVTIKVPDSPSGQSDPFEDPSILSKLHVEFDYRKATGENRVNYINFPALHALIEEYSTQMDGIPFTIPLGAFKAIHYFENLSKSRLLLIAGDQGYSSIPQLKESGEPRLAIHGAFSMGVNYHSIGRYFNNIHGHGYLLNHSDPLFQVFCGVATGKAEEYPELSAAYEDNFGAFDPKDYWNLANLMQTEWPNPSLDALLLTLKLGFWDPMNFYAFYGMVRSQLPSATEDQKELLKDGIHNVWENFYPIHPIEGEFIMNLGVLFFDMQRFAEALGFFQRSLSITGDNPTTYTNMAACYLSLFNPEAAHRCFEKAKVLLEAISSTHGQKGSC